MWWTARTYSRAALRRLRARVLGLTATHGVDVAELQHGSDKFVRAARQSASTVLLGVEFNYSDGIWRDRRTARRPRRRSLSCLRRWWSRWPRCPWTDSVWGPSGRHEFLAFVISVWVSPVGDGGEFAGWGRGGVAV